MKGSDDYRLSAGAFYGVSVVTPHPLLGGKDNAPSARESDVFQ